MLREADADPFLGLGDIERLSPSSSSPHKPQDAGPSGGAGLLRFAMRRPRAHCVRMGPLSPVFGEGGAGRGVTQGEGGGFGDASQTQNSYQSCEKAQRLTSEETQTSEATLKATQLEDDTQINEVVGLLHEGADFENLTQIAALGAHTLSQTSPGQRALRPITSDQEANVTRNTSHSRLKVQTECEADVSCSQLRRDDTQMRDTLALIDDTEELEKMVEGGGGGGEEGERKGAGGAGGAGAGAGGAGAGAGGAGSAQELECIPESLTEPEESLTQEGEGGERGEGGEGGERGGRGA
eukprot:3934207-Rhodomonas_salina.3